MSTSDSCYQLKSEAPILDSGHHVLNTSHSLRSQINRSIFLVRLNDPIDCLNLRCLNPSTPGWRERHYGLS